MVSNMQGYARLNRVSSTVAELECMSAKAWQKFLATLLFDKPLEFNEGDVGLAGGVQVTEPGNLNPTSIESIRRYGGSTAPSMPWPEEPGDYGAEDKFEKLEKLIIRTTKNLGKGRDRRGHGVSGASGAMSSMAAPSSDGGDSANSS